MDLLLSLYNLTTAAQRPDLAEICLVIDCMSLADVHPWSTVSNQWHSSGRLNCSAISDCFSVTSSFRAQWWTFSSPSCCGTYAWWYPVNPFASCLHYVIPAVSFFICRQIHWLHSSWLTLILINSLTLIDILLLDDGLLGTTRYSLAADQYGIAPVHCLQVLQVLTLSMIFYSYTYCLHQFPGNKPSPCAFLSL